LRYLNDEENECSISGANLGTWFGRTMNRGPRRGDLRIAGLCALLLLTLALAQRAGEAATTTTTFSVTATVTATCSVSATTLAFGTYAGTVTSGTSTVSVTCSNSAPYDIGLSAGAGTGATVTTRTMTGPSSAALSYGLFTDSAHATNWGNTVGTDTVSGTGNGSAQSVTIYGLIAAGQLVAAGSFMDTITATVTY